ncbi:MAG: DegT/DnrJ/EryC1/StrS family aminotransferase [Myxococcota bacterium]
MGGPIRYPIIRPTLPDFSEVEEDLRAIWESGMLTTSRMVRALEAEVAELCGVEHCIAMANCTSGLMLAVKALGLTGEVILPAFTFAATGHALIWNDLEPVFVDCDPNTYTIDPERVREAITERTSAIIAVHLFGLPPDIDALEAIVQEHGLTLLFDAAQGLGATYKGKPVGGFGAGEVFSMSPTKVITACEGGLVTTHDAELAQTMRQMRDYGKSLDGYDTAFIGLNARQSEFHAVVGRAALRHLDTYMGHRLNMIALYRELLTGLKGVSFQHFPDDRTTNGNYMVMRIDEEEANLSRDALYDALLEQGIQTKKYFSPALHRHSAYARWGARYEGKVPEAERLSHEGLVVPLYGHISVDACREIAGVIRNILD